jgi:hypothetical protein
LASAEPRSPVTEQRRWGAMVWGATFFVVFLAVVCWFDTVDFYHRHFFDRGFLVFADNLARVGFLLILTWLIYAPGAALASRLLRRSEQVQLTLAERWGSGSGSGFGTFFC